MKARAREYMMRAANKGTKLIGAVGGEGFPFWYVIEYPRSGGTWLSRMVADYLALPFPQHPIFPLGFACVVHSHWKPERRLRRVLYLVRDGRDIMVSFYFFRMRAIARWPDRPHNAALARRYEKAFGKGYDFNDTRAFLPRFIDLEMKRPRSCRMNWPSHVAAWKRLAGPNLAWLTYEDLLDRPVETLATALSALGVEDVDRGRLEATVTRFSFENMTGRKAGEEARSDFARKGVAGDWRNHFTRAAAEVFDRWAGDALIDLGYEPDRSWVEGCEP